MAAPCISFGQGVYLYISWEMCKVMRKHKHFYNLRHAICPSTFSVCSPQLEYCSRRVNIIHYSFGSTRITMKLFAEIISWLGPFCKNIVEDLITRGYTCRLDDNNFASSSAAQTHSSSRSPHPSTSSPSSYENFQVSRPPDLFMSGPPTLDWLPTSHPSTPTHQPNKTSSVLQYGQSPHNTASSASPRTDISDITSFLSDSSPHASSTYCSVSTANSHNGSRGSLK